MPVRLGAILFITEESQ